jgi:hypothetical protein
MPPRHGLSATNLSDWEQSGFESSRQRCRTNRPRMESTE